jgi:hypothetical protein
MAVFYAGYGHVALPNEQLPKGGRISSCISDDEGRTWTDAQVLYDGPDDDRDPSIVQLKNGQLICNFFSLRKTDQPGKRWTGLGSWMVTSDDMGRTWSEPKQITAEAYCSAPSRSALSQPSFNLWSVEFPRSSISCSRHNATGWDLASAN